MRRLLSESVLDANERQMAELTAVIEAVADHEFVLDLEADVFHRDVDLTATGLAQQACCAERFRVSGAKDLLQVRQREPGIDDVLDDDDVAPLKRRVQVLQESNLSRCVGRSAVARDGNEIERDRSRRHRPGKVGEEHKGAFQHGDKVQLVARRVRPIDLSGQFADARLNLLGGKQRRHSGCER